jgi:hypothetical protein
LALRWFPESDNYTSKPDMSWYFTLTHEGAGFCSKGTDRESERGMRENRDRESEREMRENMNHSIAILLEHAFYSSLA